CFHKANPDLNFYEKSIASYFLKSRFTISCRSFYANPEKWCLIKTVCASWFQKIKYCFYVLLFTYGELFAVSYNRIISGEKMTKIQRIQYKNLWKETIKIIPLSLIIAIPGAELLAPFLVMRAPFILPECAQKIFSH
ncbi:hypothetical protein MXB_4908, partial [Myxobolus squamalis]